MEFLLIFIIMLILFFLRVPIVFSILIITLFYAKIFNPVFPLIIIPKRMIFGINSFPLMAVPFFILAAELMNDSGITSRIFNFCKHLVGHIRGGLAHVNIVASIVMAGMSGSAVADASGLGKIEIAAMTEAGYDPDFSAAVTSASSTIGPIIPPSITAVIYAVIADVSVGRLLLAGIVPGVLMGVGLMIVASAISVRRNYPKHNRSNVEETFKSFIAALAPLFMPIILVGGIISGVFTPTEAAVVASVYALILAVLSYKGMKKKEILKKLFQLFIKAGMTTAVILVVISAASVLSEILLREQLPQQLSQWVLGVTSNPYIVLLMLNILFLILGCFIEGTSIIVMVVPILIPLLVHVGIDPLHFGIVLIINVMLGLITPPFGVCMFITSDIAGITTQQFVKAIFPFLMILVGVLFLTTYIPSLSMFIPSLIMK